MTDWHGKPYYSLDAYCKNTYHHKCYKIALNAHMTCPNRDGTLDTRGCIFCSSGGSGEFAIPLFEGQPNKESQADQRPLDIDSQLRAGLALFREKQVGDHFIAYFQAYTNTYAPLPYLEKVYRSALDHPAVCGISIATRPDCLGAEVLTLLQALKTAYPNKFLWVELGLQTIHEKTALSIRRGYALPIFEKAFQALTRIGIPVIVHVILGLPGETEAMQLETLDYLNRLCPFGIKLQLLHILKNTDLARDYQNGKVPVLSREDYLTLLCKSIARLRPEIVIHRLTGDGAGSELIAPQWSRNKKAVLNELHHRLKTENIRQGIDYDGSLEGEKTWRRI